MFKKVLLASAIFLPAIAAAPLLGQDPPAGSASTQAVATTAPAGPGEATVRKNAAGEVSLTFENVTVGKAVPSWSGGGITFTLAGPLKNSAAQGRVMFFPHLKTERRGILNAMATQQDVPVKAEIVGGASSVTLVLWGTIGCRAQVKAYDKEGTLIDTASLPATVPERKSPSEPIPTFELTVKGENIAYILFNGAPNGGALVADEVRYLPKP